MGTAYAAMERQRERFRTDLEALLRRVDLIIAPAMAQIQLDEIHGTGQRREHPPETRDPGVPEPKPFEPTTGQGDTFNRAPVLSGLARMTP